MFWIWILATLSAFFLKGLCGFANTMVFDSILGFLGRQSLQHSRLAESQVMQQEKPLETY